MNDKSTRVRRAAITGLLIYPDHTSIPLLIENLRKIEKQKPKLYREWVVTRNALETLSGQYFRESVEDWARWWDIEKNKFTIAKLVEETKGKEGDSKKGGTFVAKKDGSGGAGPREDRWAPREGIRSSSSLGAERRWTTSGRTSTVWKSSARCIT